MPKALAKTNRERSDSVDLTSTQSSSSHHEPHNTGTNQGEPSQDVECRLRGGGSYSVAVAQGANSAQTSAQSSSPALTPTEGGHPPALSFGQSVRVFCSSLSPTSQAGVGRPYIRCPRTLRECRPLIVGLIGLTGLGAAARLGALLYDAYHNQTDYRNYRHPSPASVHTPHTPSTQLTSAEQQPAATSASTSTEQPRPSTSQTSHTDVAPIPAPEPKLIYTANDLKVIREIPIAHALQLREEAARADVQRTADPVTLPPNPFREFRAQVICRVPTGETTDVTLTWTNDQHVQETLVVHCTESRVIEMPADARNVTVNGAPTLSAEGRLLWASVNEGGVSTVGYSASELNQHNLESLTSRLYRAQEWNILETLTSHILNEIQPSTEPQFIGQMQTYHTEAQSHMHHHSPATLHAAALAGIGFGAAGLYAGYWWYRGYQQGRHGWNLFTYPAQRAQQQVAGLFGRPSSDTARSTRDERTALLDAMEQGEPNEDPSSHIDQSAGFHMENESTNK